MKAAGCVLTRDAEVLLSSLWRFQATKLTFERPHIIHPRARCALDDLSSAGLLEVATDPRGPMTWTPTDAGRSMARRVRVPRKNEGYKLTDAMGV